MKKLILWTAAALVVGAFAVETNLNAVVAATLRADGSTNTWTHADLREALGLLNRKYWRDMESQEGRRKWHGKHTNHYVTNMAERTVERIEIYADGFTNVVKGTKRKLLTPEEEAVRYLERKEKAAKAKRDRIAGLRARIAMLEAQTNSYAQAAQPLSEDDSIELSRATINLIKCRQLLKRMEAQATTNIVTVVTGPGQTNEVDIVVQPAETENLTAYDAYYSDKEISPYALIWRQDLIDKQVRFWKRLAEVTGVEWRN